MINSFKNFYFVVFLVTLSSCQNGFYLEKEASQQSFVSQQNSVPGGSSEVDRTPVIDGTTLPENNPQPIIPGGTSPVQINSKPTNGKGGNRGIGTGVCQGGRNYQLYVPPTYNENRATSIVVAMHGNGDSFTNFTEVVFYSGWRDLADKENLILMIPASTNTNRRSFVHVSSSNVVDVPSTLNEGQTLLECIYKDVGSRYNIETHGIYWIGFSEGAYFSSFMINQISQRIRAVAVYGGSSPKLNSNISRKTPLLFVTGTSDFFYEQVQQHVRQWSDHVIDTRYVNAGHNFIQLNSLVKPDSVWSWLKNSQSSPVESGF